MPSRTSRVIGSLERRGGWSGPTAPIIAGAALALLGVFLASGDARGQSAPQDLTLGGAPDKATAISISAQVSLVWQTDAHIMAANSSFNDNRLGAEATNGAVIDTLQKAAVSALSQAAMSGARTGHVDVVATVYRFAGDAASVDAWAPVGIFINTTDMAVATGGQAAFHTRVQFIPDASRTAAAGADAPAR